MIKKIFCFFAFLIPAISYAETFGPSIHHIEVAGATVTARDTLNFVSGATVVDNAISSRTDVTIVGGGGGGNIIAVGTGTAANFTTIITSPAINFSFLGSQFNDTTSGTTNFIAVNTASFTMYGPNIPASAISAGSLGANVRVSSLTAVVGAGSCTNCNATFNAQGQATAFSNGSSGGGTASLPLPPGDTNYVWITTGAVQSGAFKISSGTVNTLSASSITVVESNSIIQYAASGSANSATSGMRVNTNDTVEILSRGNSALRVNATPQILAVSTGTNCLPTYSFVTDGGTGISLPVIDSLQFDAGCSTGMVIHQHDFPLPKDSTLANIFSVYGGSLTSTTQQNTKVDFGIWTATITSTAAQVAQANQVSVQVTISGHDLSFSNAYTDMIMVSFYNANVFVVSSHDDIGSPPARTYTSGGGSTGIVNCSIPSGTYYIQAWHTQLGGK